MRWKLQDFIQFSSLLQRQHKIPFVIYTQFDLRQNWFSLDVILYRTIWKWNWLSISGENPYSRLVEFCGFAMCSNVLFHIIYIVNSNTTRQFDWILSLICIVTMQCISIFPSTIHTIWPFASNVSSRKYIDQ